ncbi:MAG: ABC transporter permease [Rhodospirillaceae bacterium]|nr:ABC transporter permease [Rhodospirillaceae bacterium]
MPADHSPATASSATGGGPTRTRQVMARLGPALAGHVLVVAVWHVAVVWGEIPSFVMPSPLATVETLLDPSYQWLRHIGITAAEVFGGYVLAVSIGVGLAVAFSWSRAVERGTMPVLVTLNMIPKVAMAPLFIVWLRYGIFPNMVIAFTISFFPILLTTMRGLKEVEPDLLDLVRALNGSRWQIFAKIQLPGALPYLFSGMKVATVLAVAGAIVGEFMGSSGGLGYLMQSRQGFFDTAGMFMAVILVSLIGVIMYGLVLLLERLFVVSDARIQ